MMRLIDADALIEKKWQAENEACFYALEGVVSVTDIEEAPSIDLVRCGECIHHKDFPTGISPITCNLSWGGVFENDFCSYGERREDNE